MRGLGFDLILNFGVHKSKSHFLFGKSIGFILLVWFGLVWFILNSSVGLDVGFVWVGLAIGLDWRLGWAGIGYPVYAFADFFFLLFGLICLVCSSSSSFYVGYCWRTGRGVVGEFFGNVIKFRVHILCSWSREK